MERRCIVGTPLPLAPARSPLRTKVAGTEGPLIEPTLMMQYLRGDIDDAAVRQAWKRNEDGKKKVNVDLKTAAWECGCCGEGKAAEHYSRVGGHEVRPAVEELILQRGAWRTCLQCLRIPNEKDMRWSSISREQLPRM